MRENENLLPVLKKNFSLKKTHPKTGPSPAKDIEGKNKMTLVAIHQSDSTYK